jgi:hypothetical protein
MNRRQILSRLSAFLLSVAAIPRLGWASIKESSSVAGVHVSKGAEPFTTVREFESLIHPNKLYPNIKAFWLDHPDRASDALKSEYIAKGLLVSKSILLKNGKIVRQTKTFKSEKSFRQYQKSMKAYYSRTGKTFKESLKRVS